MTYSADEPSFPEEAPRSPLVNALNNLVRTQDRWCTPSILPDQHKVIDEYDDVSVSAGSLGNLLQHSGHFRTAEEFAAKAYCADRTFLSPHGSTGANAIVLRMLALERRDALVLVARNVHHSIINALKMFSIDFRFLPNPRYDAHFDAILPPKMQDVRDGLNRYPETLAVIYTSPTYEGLGADTMGIIHDIRENKDFRNVIVAVDEAWGGHLPFFPSYVHLPKAAMEEGADIAVQSTHKMAGSLQQGALLHWHSGRVNDAIMEEAYREYVTTSPSYHLLGSVDAALRLLDERGPRYLGISIELSESLRAGLAQNLPRLEILRLTDDESLFDYSCIGIDPTKTTLGLSAYDVSGFELAQTLADNGVIVERAGLNSVVLVTTFQLHDGAVDRAVNAITNALRGKEIKGTKRLLDNPFSAAGNWQKMRPYEVVRYANYLSQEVPLSDAVGSIAAESVELYPPGVPILLEGYEVTREAIDYLRGALNEKAHLVARDSNLGTLRVLRPSLGMNSVKVRRNK
ncbi:decarboxylase [Streptomyces sp. Tu 2975]|uniref:aminotransferase class I/II-fold pyridoxal phosphate-dependent enzyme n=1 Tax=Streptomyces sp. Tu 2975 TaxID=2676871 RepID=UPI001358E80F|nr:decarboxylase [Streptomyces sp. Tu 2975]QIP84665.1 decarboxylase [Streptomyces sp. Tu 2975]